MATKSLGRVSIVPQGDYNENQVYKRLDLVKDGGKTYLSLKEDNTNLLEDEDSWMLLTESGSFEDLTPQELETLLQPLNEATDAANQAAEAANEAAANATTGISGEATEVNSPEPTGFFRYIVTEPITTGSAWGIEVTQAELNSNWVFFHVKDGVITKDSKPQQSGKSAYQLAVDNGFVGTEAEWLESLKGEDGTNAKLPLYSAIKSANIPAGTQFIYDEGDNEILRTTAILLTTDNPLSVIDVKTKYVGGTGTGSGGNLFEAMTSILAGVPKTLSGNAFMPILNKKPVSVEVFAGGVKQSPDITFVKNGAVYDIIINSDVDIFNADVNVFGSNLDFKELEDVNNFGRFVFSDDSNIRTTTDNLLQLRDITKGNALGPELIINNSFDDATGWTVAVNGTWEISGGKLRALATNAAGNTVKTFATVNGVFRMRFDVDAVSAGSITVNGTLQNVTMSTAGTRELDLIATSTAIGFRKTSTSAGVVDNVYAWRILGNHLVQPTVINAPKVYSTYVEFDGIDDTMQTAVSSDTIGSIYIVAQRVGTDTSFVVLNSLSGIGEISGGVIYIGSNAAKTTFYKVRIKEILIRSVTDGISTVEKLNSYYTNLLNS